MSHGFSYDLATSYCVINGMMTAEVVSWLTSLILREELVSGDGNIGTVVDERVHGAR